MPVGKTVKTALNQSPIVFRIVRNEDRCVLRQAPHLIIIDPVPLNHGVGYPVHGNGGWGDRAARVFQRIQHLNHAQDSRSLGFILKTQDPEFNDAVVGSIQSSRLDIQNQAAGGWCATRGMEPIARP